MGCHGLPQLSSHPRTSTPNQPVSWDSSEVLVPWNWAFLGRISDRRDVMIHDRCHLFHQNQDLAKQASDSDLFGEKCRGNLPTYTKYLPTFTIHTKKWGVLCVKMPNVPLVSVAWIHPCFHQSWDLACAWHFQKIASLKCFVPWILMNKAGQNWQFDAICWFPSGDMTIPQSNYTIQLWTRPSENPTLDHGTPGNIRLCICEIVGVKHSTVYDKNKWRSLGVSKVMEP
jgi:hypothetical protein